jgi:replicative DNA helicase
MEFRKGVHYSGDLEGAILGACLIEKEAFGRTFGLIEKEHFYYTGNRIVYTALAQMYNEGLMIDLITVFDYIQNVNKIDSINGLNIPYYISKLTTSVVSSAHIEYHSFIIKRMWMERELISLTHGGTILDGEIPDQIYQLTKAIEKINTGQFQKEWFDMKDVMMQLAKHQDLMTSTGGKGLPTGILKLDEENGGLFPGMLVVIGARPSVGKSAFMGQMALSMARNGKKVGIVSLEMNNNEIAARLSSIETHTDFKTIFRNLFKDENSRQLWYNKLSNFTNLPIYITDKTNVSATNIKAKAQKLRHEIKGLDCLFIDYLQLVSSEGESKSRNRENEVSQISRTCKLIAKDLNIPVIILCQLNRDVTKRTGKNRYPQLSDLRESGAIEQDADVVMFLHRDWTTGIQEYMYDENGNSKENHADLIIRKWRNGANNIHIELEFDAPKMQFIEKNAYTFSPVEEIDNQIKENPF